MANYPQELAQDAVCQSHTGHMTGLWFLPTRPLRLNTNEWMNEWMELSDQLLASDWSLVKEEHCGLFWSSLLWWQHNGSLSQAAWSNIYIYIYNIYIYTHTYIYICVCACVVCVCVVCVCCVCVCSCWKIILKWIRELVFGGVSWNHWTQSMV